MLLVSCDLGFHLLLAFLMVFTFIKIYSVLNFFYCFIPEFLPWWKCPGITDRHIYFIPHIVTEHLPLGQVLGHTQRSQSQIQCQCCVLSSEGIKMWKEWVEPGISLSPLKCSKRPSALSSPLPGNHQENVSEVVPLVETFKWCSIMTFHSSEFFKIYESSYQGTAHSD